MICFNIFGANELFIFVRWNINVYKRIKIVFYFILYNQFSCCKIKHYFLIIRYYTLEKNSLFSYILNTESNYVFNNKQFFVFLTTYTMNYNYINLSIVVRWKEKQHRKLV